jgi:nucleoside-diphosphate-sugar epimerase
VYDPSREYAASALVLGATGAIGRAVSRELVVNGYRVYGLTRSADAMSRLPYAVVGVMGDIRSPERWENVIERVDVVINCAAPAGLVSGRMDRANAQREAEALAEILDRLCATMRRAKKRLVHTFGALLYEPDAQGWVRENYAISSGRGFGIRHRLAHPVLARHRKKGLKVVSMCPAFIYGRGGWFESGVLEPMAQGKSSLIGDGTQTMHYVAASDVAAGYRLAIEHGLDGEEYLLADDQPVTLGSFTRLTAKEMGAPPPAAVPEEELSPVIGDWAVEAYTFCSKVDSAKAREQLGWAPRFRTVEEGVPVVVREYKRARIAQLATAR